MTDRPASTPTRGPSAQGSPHERIDELKRTIACMAKAAQRATVALNSGQIETVAQALAGIRREGE